jgi:ribosome-binding protein aMBF1 (putative translation factor)
VHIARWDWEPDTGFDEPVIDRAVRRLGRAIYVSRRRHRWSQRKLAERSGVDQGSISRLERGLLVMGV